MNSNLLVVTVVFFAVFYVLFIRPENVRKKRAEEMRNNIRKGEQITTIGGMKGKVVHVTDDSVVFETGEDRVRIEVAKWGIQSTESTEAQLTQTGFGLFGKKSPSAEESQTEETRQTNADPEIK